MRAARALAEEFIGRHPTEASRVLDGLPPKRILQLLDGLPVELAASCLAHLASGRAAELLTETTAERAAKIFEKMQAHEVTSVLRLMSPEQIDRLLSATSTALAEPIRRLLRHPEGTAGALMDPRAPALPAEISAVEARSLLKSSYPHALYYVYVVDRDRRLTGVINLRQLLTTSSKQSLESLMRRSVVSLPSAADRVSILGHPGWRELHALPVVDKAGRFLGVLRHETVRRLEAEVPDVRGHGGTLAAAVAFGELCWVTWSKIIEDFGTLAAAQTVRRHTESGEDRDSHS